MTKLRIPRIPAVSGWLAALCAGTALAQPRVVDLGALPGSEGAAVRRINGFGFNDRIGGDGPSGLAVGDLDRDGFDDLVIGVPEAEVALSQNSGEIYVFRGGANFRTNGTALPSTILGAGPGHRAGTAVACGDFDGDGFDDLAIGSPGAEGFGDEPGAGRVAVIFGDPTLPLLVALALPLNVERASIRFDEAGGGFGTALAAGDLDGDGIDDLAIGGRTASPLGRSRAGRVEVIFGGAALRGSVVEIARDDPSPGVRVVGGSPFDQAGAALACGDFDADGRTDLLIGGPTSTPNLREAGKSAGRTWIVFGAPALGSMIDLALGPDGQTTRFVHGSNPNPEPPIPPPSPGFQPPSLIGSHLYGALGTVVAAADLDGDGYDEAFMGSPGVSRPRALTVFDSQLHEGRLDILFGWDGIRGDDIALDFPVAGAVFAGISGKDNEGYAGKSAATADVNGDGYPDAIVTAWRTDTAGGTKDDAGEAYVVFGGPHLRDANLRLAFDAPDWEIRGAAAYDFFGSSAIGGADFDGDGIADFAVGAMLADGPLAGTDGNTGTIYIFFGERDPGATQAPSVEVFKPGPVALRGFGGRLSTVIRARMAFPGGSDGAGGPTPLSATLIRGKAGLSGFSPFADLADVAWRIEGNRVGFGNATLELEYLDSEIAGIPGLDENELMVFHSPGPNGPWTRRDTIVHASRNAVEATATSFGYFAIARSGIPLGDRVLRFVKGIDSDPDGLDVNGDGTVGIDDYAAAGGS